MFEAVIRTVNNRDPIHRACINPAELPSPRHMQVMRQNTRLQRCLTGHAAAVASDRRLHARHSEKRTGQGILFMLWEIVF